MHVQYTHVMPMCPHAYVCVHACAHEGGGLGFIIIYRDFQFKLYIGFWFRPGFGV